MAYLKTHKNFSYFLLHSYIGEDLTINNDFDYQCGLERLGLLKGRLNELHSDIISVIGVEDTSRANLLTSYQECKTTYDRQLEEIDSYASYFLTDSYGIPQNKRAFRRAKDTNPRTRGENKSLDKKYSHDNKYAPKSSSSRKKRQDTRPIWSQSRVPMFNEHAEAIFTPMEFESRSKDEKKSNRSQLSKPVDQTTQTEHTVQSKDELKFLCSMLPSYHKEEKGRSKTLKSLRQQKFCAFDEV